MKIKTVVVYLWTNVVIMKKDKSKNYKIIDPELSIVSEPEIFYSITKNNPVSKDFTYNDFVKIAEKVPFTMAEWASILHVSERTLQRYAKSNSSFAAIKIGRAHV